MAGEKILVVDDEQLTRTLLVTLLRREGYLVESARDGEEALRALAVRATDLVVTDLMMDGTDGLRLLEQVRARPQRRL